MTKTSSRLSVTVAASMLGIALAAASGAYAATGALTTRDAPGQVLQVSGVVPASDHAQGEQERRSTASSSLNEPRTKRPIATSSARSSAQPNKTGEVSGGVARVVPRSRHLRGDHVGWRSQGAPVGGAGRKRGSKTGQVV